MSNTTNTTIDPNQETAKVRLLRDGPYGQCDDVVFIAKNLVEGYSKGGMVDASPEAVAYAESLKN